MQINIKQVEMFLNNIKDGNCFTIEIDNEDGCINILEENDYGIEFAEILEDEDIVKLYEYLDSNNIEYSVRNID